MRSRRPRRFIFAQRTALAGAIVVASGALVRAADTAPAAHDYFRYCANCHGAKGRGNGPQARQLEAPPDDLSDCRATGKVSDDQFFKAIKQGGLAAGMGPEMPAWSGTLDDAQIHALVAYVRCFCRDRQASPGHGATR